MNFRQHQAHAQAHSARLFAWFALLLLALVAAVNGLLALLYKLLMPMDGGFPALFFETNSAVVLLFVLGGCLLETQRLREGGGPGVARWMNGRAVTEPDDPLERRLLNVVDEMALVSGQAVPQVYVLTREDAINAFVAGWSAQDIVLCVTRGALERLTRAELQGLVAHEFGHLKEGDLPITMRLLGLVWGLSLIHGYGQTLMSADDEGHVSPLAWLVGAVFALIGWLGWIAGRALQAAVSRQREFLADACAIQWTRTRDGLGNVLRKVWHDQQMLAGRMRHPQAPLMASLLLHEGRTSRCLASHPRLSQRIFRICGAVLPPLPAPLLRPDSAEPRRRPASLAAADGALSAVPVWPATSANTSAAMTAPMTASGASRAGPALAQGSDPFATAMNAAQDGDALARLRRLSGPREKRLTVLALMMSMDNAAEKALWRRLAEGLTHAEQILADVACLGRQRLVPEFERLCHDMAREPLADRRALVESARDLLRADGRVSARERLWWLALRRRLGERQETPPLLRPVTGQGQDLSSLKEPERADVAALTAYLARFVPQDETGSGQLAPASQAWHEAVMRRCVAPPLSAPACQPPDADALMSALAGVQELSWMVRPILLRAWVEEALNHSAGGLMSDDTANDLRLVAGLIDAPLPPALQAPV